MIAVFYPQFSILYPQPCEFAILER